MWGDELPELDADEVHADELDAEPDNAEQRELVLRVQNRDCEAIGVGSHGSPFQTQPLTSFQ